MRVASIGFASVDRFEFVDALAERDAVRAGQRHARLEMTAQRQQARRRAFDGDRRRRIASRTSQHEFAPADDSCHRVVERPHDRPVMNQEYLGNSRKTAQRVALIDNDWLVRNIAARRYDRKAEFAHQKMMQWRVGEHHAEQRILRRHC